MKFAEIDVWERFQNETIFNSFQVKFFSVEIPPSEFYEQGNIFFLFTDCHRYYDGPYGPSCSPKQFYVLKKTLKKWRTKMLINTPSEAAKYRTNKCQNRVTT